MRNKKHFLLLLILLMAQMLYAETTAHQPVTWSDGSGGVISNLAELRWLSETSDAWDENWILTANIDASETKTWDTGQGFSPIGNDSIKFTGIFDGQDNEISNLYINRPTADCIGLFADISSATIENVGIIDCNVTGESFVGGAVGRSIMSIISRCYSTGHIKGETAIGGLIGSMFSSIVSNCYSTGNVMGKDYYISGLVGVTFVSTVEYCYATGSVVGKFCNGGLIADYYNFNNYNYYYSGAVTANYWNIETSGQVKFESGELGNPDGKIEGKTSAEMKMQSTYVGWDFTRKWSIEEGENYPQLRKLPSPPNKDGDTYLISNFDDLYWLSQQPNVWKSKFKLTANIDASETKTQEIGFTPIGNAYNRFSGNFDGQGYAISNLYINSHRTNRIGLFGYLDSATVENVGIVDCNVTGQLYVGGLAGKSVASVVRCCYSIGTVKGDNYVGGLIGDNDFSRVSNCYVFGTVSGGFGTGGLVGINDSTSITNCYTKTTMLKGGTYAKGIVGWHHNSILTANYWDIEISGKEHSGEEGTGEIAGKTTAEMKRQSTYMGWDFETIWAIATDINNNYPFLQIQVKGKK